MINLYSIKLISSFVESVTKNVYAGILTFTQRFSKTLIKFWIWAVKNGYCTYTLGFIMPSVAFLPLFKLLLNFSLSLNISIFLITIEVNVANHAIK